MCPNLSVLPRRHPFIGPRETPSRHPELIERAYDVLVIPGDLGLPVEEAIPLLTKLGRPVVLTLGNSDLRTPTLRRPGNTLSERFETAQRLARGSEVHVLNRGEVVIQGHRFVGAHLGFGLHGHSPQLASAFSSLYNDLKWGCYEDLFQHEELVATAKQLLMRKGVMDVDVSTIDHTPENPHFVTALLVASFQRDLRWLRAQLAVRGQEPLIVVTHTSPDSYEFDSTSHKSLDRLLLEQPIRNRDMAALALNANWTEATLGSLNTQNCAAWIYGQGKSGALRLASTGVPLVSCGANIPNSISTGLPVRAFTPLLLKEELLARRYEDFQRKIRSSVGELQTLLKALQLPALSKRQQPLRNLLFSQLQEVQEQVQQFFTENASHSAPWRAAVTRLDLYAECPRSLPSAAKRLRGLVSLLAIPSDVACTSDTGGREFLVAEATIAACLAEKGIKGRTLPENPVQQRYCDSGRHLVVELDLPPKCSPVEADSAGFPAHHLSLESELHRALTVTFRESASKKRSRRASRSNSPFLVTVRTPLLPEKR